MLLKLERFVIFLQPIPNMYSSHISRILALILVLLYFHLV